MLKTCRGILIWFFGPGKKSFLYMDAFGISTVPPNAEMGGCQNQTGHTGSLTVEKYGTGQAIVERA
jgi:hypothetical protein